MPNSIRKYRLLSGFTQEELAKAVDCARETISNLEHDLYRPSWRLVHRLSEELQVCPCLLMADSHFLCDLLYSDLEPF